MDAVPEREVAVVGAVDVERVGVAEPCSRRGSRRPGEMITCAPAGIVTPPISIGSAA